MTQRVRMKRWKALCCHVSTAADTQQLTQTFKARRFSTCAWSCITVLVGRRVRLSGPEEQGRLTRLRRESIIDEDEACLEHIDLARGAPHLQLMRAHYITEQQGGGNPLVLYLRSIRHSRSVSSVMLSAETCPVLPSQCL